MYKRVLLKMSGEAIKGDTAFGIDSQTLGSIAKQIKAAHDLGVEIGIVVGGGNIWRGKTASELGMERAQADYMGMLATIMNGLAVQDALEQVGVPTRVLSALTINEITEPYIRRRAVRHLEKGRVCIFVGGIGSPYFSTDTACVLRATEIGAEIVLMAKNKTEGVYDSDPRTNPNAKLYSELTFSEILAKDLKVMDATAASLCKDNGLNLIVFNMNTEGNIVRAVNGEKIGTFVKVK
ncbi:MAG: UMP kinase [Roseburia sp.]|nr:UMP kinase [Anaeroplasma bactoclasticum]MCM1195571.1 UMP kinase [Roseburia sp.]MCM1555986.1 UMP kinase [Anaeroplasma bactoclasticum]